MHLFSLLTFAVFAAETVLSPIPEDMPSIIESPAQPEISFGEIVAMPTPTLSPTPKTQPSPPATAGKSYTIAFLGDSMIDTMGPDLPAVQSKLSATYPATNFTLLNYGVGGTNIDSGIERIPSLASSHPDIVVVESFAYNPFPEVTGVDRHWLAMARAVDSIHTNIPNAKIIIAATIAPNSTVFVSRDHASTVKQYLESTVKFAVSQHLPLADAYHASLTDAGEGNLTYINGGDHIHYSDAGRAMFAQKVTDAITANHLLQ